MNKKEILRKCIVTNRVIDVNEMIRVVKDKEDNIFLDYNKHIQGRGAYITNEFKLIIQALERKMLNRAFKANISKDVYDKLKQEAIKYEENKNKEQ
jgi:hypothetical protein